MKSKQKPGKKDSTRSKQRPRVVVLEDDDEDVDEQELELEDVDEADLAAAALELDAADGGSVRVRKLDPKEEAGDCDSYPLSIMPTLTEQLRADWGDGKYAITIRRSNGQIVRRGIKQLAKRPARVAPAIDALQIRRDAREELQAQMQPMLEMMRTTLGALAGRPAPAADPLALQASLLDSVVKLKAITDRGSGKGELGNLRELLALAKDFGGEGKGGAGITDVALKFLDKLNFETPAPALPASSPASGPAPAREESMGIVQRAIAQRIPILLRGAIQGTEASVYAQLVLDQLPDEYLGVVAQQLKRVDWWEQLVAIAPDVVPHREWFLTLRDEVLREIETPPAPGG